jgi:glycosyltransferase involved in cell wall biosynthesis
MKVAIISHVLPPVWSGQSILISRLLRDRPPEEYCLISEHDWAKGAANQSSPRLPGNYHVLSTKGLLRRGQRLDAVQSFNAGVLGRRVARIARSEGCDAVLAFTGSLLDLPAGLAASRALGVPFYAYACDYYSQQQTDARARAVAERIEPRVLRGARAVIVPNEFLRDELKRRYGVESEIVRNPCDLGPYVSAPDYAGGEERRVVYTGAVYEAHYDAFRNLVGAIELLGREDVRLHLYTAQTPEELAGVGIKGPVVVHGHVAASDVPAIQKQADVLFLPLAFESPYPVVIKTSAPFKTGEYLAARRPVVVHAPADSFLAWYFREHGCGEVVDRLDPSALASALSSLLDDESRGREMAERGWERARADFGIERARERFAEVIGRV